MNRGDAGKLSLTIIIDTEPITEGYADDIEVTFNPDNTRCCVKKLLSKGEVIWDSENDEYTINLTQNDTFKMHEGDNKVQIRILKDSEVLSSDLTTFIIGAVNSEEVLL